MTAIPKGLRSTWLNSTDGVRLNFRIDNLDSVMETWESVKLFRADTEDGSYSAIGSPVTLVADTNEYTITDATGDETKWYKVAFYEAAGPTDGDKTDPVCGSGGGRYATVAGMRDVGYAATLYTNDAMRTAIQRAERFVERITGNVFIPQQRSFRVDPRPSLTPTLLLDVPIIQIDAVTIVEYVDDGTSSIYDYLEVYEISVADVKVYNRHLTQGLVNPDDRDSPRLHLIVDHWGNERQSVKLDGWFGYTELGIDETPAETADGSQIPTSRGETPDLVVRAVELLLPRFLASPADQDDYEESLRWRHVERYKARDQEIKYSPGSTLTGGITGDADVDAFLEHFLSPVATGELV